MQRLHDVGQQAAPKSRSESIRKSITALALLLFLSGLFLPFLADRAYSVEYLPPERLGYEWLFKGIVQNVRNVARRAINNQPLPAHSHSWLVSTSAILCLPMSFVFVRRRCLWATGLAVVGLIGVVWVFIKASPSLFLGHIGLGFISWFLSATLATGACIRTLTAKPTRELSAPTV
jgi:hypothetical protein